MTPIESVRAVFLDFTEPLEGGVGWLYADVRNLITIAYGNLVDPIGLALALDLRKPDGIRATAQEIRDEWNRVKGDPKSASRGHLYAKTITSLRLSPEGMRDLALSRFDSNNREIAAKLPDWDSYPACALLAIHSLAWACGVGGAFKFAGMIKAVKERDFVTAARAIQINETLPNGEKNHGIIPRNRANKILMLNASRVEAYKLDPTLLEWKTDLDVMTLTKESQPDVAPEPADDGCTYAKTS